MRRCSLYTVSLVVGMATGVFALSSVSASGWSSFAGSTQEPELRTERRLVRDAQVALRDQGFYDGLVDGVPGPQTREALRNFQRARRLPATGRLDEATLKALDVKLEEERQEEKKGIFGTIGAGVETAGKTVAEGAVVGAQATAKGATAAGKATAKGATTAGKATVEGSTVAAKKTAGASTTVGKATVKGTTTTGKAVKGVFTPERSDAEILYEIQDRFKENSRIDPTHFDLGVSDGVVTLTQRSGTVSELEQAAALAKQVKGVKKVVSKRK